MRNLLFCIGCLYILATACNSKKNNAETYNRQLDSLNRNVTRGIVDTVKVAALSSDIFAYVEKNPGDTSAPRLMFNLALAQQTSRMNDQSIITLRELRRRYPDSKYAPKALMLEGFVQANVTQQYDEARKAYNEYLDKYRDVDTGLSRTVEMELQTMGKTPEQLLEEFEARRKRDSLERLPQ